MTTHKVFGEVFRTLEGRAVGTGAYHRHAGARHSQGLAQTAHEGVFVTGDYQVDVVVFYSLGHGLEVGGLEGDIGAAGRCAGVAGGDIEIAKQGALA